MLARQVWVSGEHPAIAWWQVAPTSGPPELSGAGGEPITVSPTTPSAATPGKKPTGSPPRAPVPESRLAPDLTRSASGSHHFLSTELVGRRRSDR